MCLGSLLVLYAYETWKLCKRDRDALFVFENAIDVSYVQAFASIIVKDRNHVLGLESSGLVIGLGLESPGIDYM